MNTSLEAAESVADHLPALRAKVLAYFESQMPEGATDDQAQVALGMNPSTQRPRRIELCNSGFLVNSGRVEATRSGRLATVWTVVPPDLREEARHRVVNTFDVTHRLHTFIEQLTLEQRRRVLRALRMLFPSVR